MPARWRKRLFFLLLPLLLAAIWLQVRVETDLNAFFTAVESEDAAFLASFLQSGELSRRYLIAVRPTHGNAAGADALGRELVRELAQEAAVERVWQADRAPDEWLAAVQSYAPHGSRMFSLDPETEKARLFDPTTTRERAFALKRALLGPEGAWVKEIAKQDPLLLSLQAFRGLQDRAQPAGERAGFAGLILQSRPPSLDTEAQARLQSAIRDRFERLNVNRDYTLAMTGVPVFTVVAHDQIARDVALVSAVSTVGVVAIFLVLFRSLKALAWVSLIVAASYGVGTLATAWTFGFVHSLTLALGSTLTGVSIDYPMHVLAHTAQFRGEEPDEAVRRVWPSLFVGSLTTVLGYVALGFAGFPGFQQIAVFSSAALGATLLLTRWVLPALLTSTALRPPHIPGLNGWMDFCVRRRIWLSALLVIGLCGAVALLPRMRWMDDLSKLTMEMGELKQQDKAIRDGLSGIEPGRFVLVKGSDLDSALEHAEVAERVLRGLKSDGKLKDYFGLYPWLVSSHLQTANASAYAAAVEGDFSPAWRKALAEAGLAVDKLGRLAPAQDAAAPASLLSDNVRQILSGQILQTTSGTALVIWLGAHEPAAVTQALQNLPEVRYFSQKDLLNGLAQRYRDRSFTLLGWGLLGIYALLWLRYRAARKAFFSLFPATIAGLVLFAAWAALGQEVSFLHLMCLLLAVSICEDYGIFFLDNGGGDIRATYQAIAPSMLTTAVSFAALGLAENPTLRILAGAVTLGIVLGFLLCPLLIRADRTGTA
ncbi:MMPL family transporter [Methylococcus sp. EFPC2]|uniref:MMPL family transporter n=1 Tax=Methylococcus sp. EFPC2 TaxID=2812648 RepID=UPI00196733E6|nr:MMPL family transporter [Methylococcus sp. EFPC2]QSA98866.1 MMPL family transporter [Methylococcus sp. EFPC2]